MDILNKLGIKQESKGSLPSTLMNFVREFNINPFPEEYEAIPVYDENGKIIKITIKKLCLNMDIYQMLVDELNKQNEKDKQEMEKMKLRK